MNKKTESQTIADLEVPPELIELKLVLEGEEVETIILNHRENNIDLHDPETHAYLGKLVAETLVKKERAWMEYHALVRKYCDCGAAEKKGPRRNFHSDSCASWEAEIDQYLQEGEEEDNG